jgi:hypothetical protein
MILSTVGGFSDPITVTEVPAQDQVNVVKEISKKEVEIMMSTEKYVKQYFSDIPIMVQIARCESQFRQLDKDGSIHRGNVNSEDVGVMQINEHYHLDTAEKNNYNIYTLEGNTSYARKLYEKEGTQPWSSSKACWGKYQTAQASTKDNLAMNTK